LFLKNGAGGVHDQLWQKCPVESTEEILPRIREWAVLNFKTPASQILPDSQIPSR